MKAIRWDIQIPKDRLVCFTLLFLVLLLPFIFIVITLSLPIDARYEMMQRGYTRELLVPFLRDVFRRDLCIPIQVPKNAFGVKVRLSDIEKDERGGLGIGIKSYCDIITSPQLRHFPCVAMSDIGKLPCRTDCIYLEDYVNPDNYHNSLDIICNLSTLASLDMIVTLAHSNLQWIIDAEAFIIRNGKKPLPIVYDVMRNELYNITEQLEPRSDPNKEWNFTNDPKCQKWKSN